MSGALAAMAGGGGGGQYALYIGTTTIAGASYYGFSNGTFGALSPTNFLGSNIGDLYWRTSSGGALTLAVTNSAIPNSGWSTINVNGTIFNRASATFINGIWTWAGVANPIGTSLGSTIPVIIA